MRMCARARINIYYILIIIRVRVHARALIYIIRRLSSYGGGFSVNERVVLATVCSFGGFGKRVCMCVRGSFRTRGIWSEVLSELGSWCY